MSGGTAGQSGFGGSELPYPVHMLLVGTAIWCNRSTHLRRPRNQLPLQHGQESEAIENPVRAVYEGIALTLELGEFLMAVAGCRTRL